MPLLGLFVYICVRGWEVNPAQEGVGEVGGGRLYDRTTIFNDTSSIVRYFIVLISSCFANYANSSCYKLILELPTDVL